MVETCALISARLIQNFLEWLVVYSCESAKVGSNKINTNYVAIELRYYFWFFSLCWSLFFFFTIVAPSVEKPKYLRWGIRLERLILSPSCCLLGSGSLVVIDNTCVPQQDRLIYRWGVRVGREWVGEGVGGGSVCDGAGKAFCSGKMILNNTLFIVSYC